jgi:DNA-binding NtrC family response regulator
VGNDPAMRQLVELLQRVAPPCSSDRERAVWPREGRLERQLIESTLRCCGNHKDRAAKGLGLARSSLFKGLKEWGLGQGEE